MGLKQKINDLVNQLNHYTEEYDAGQPSISDQEWDNLYFELLEQERRTGIVLPNSPTQSIYHKNLSALSKVEHDHHMLSLAKTKNWIDFLEYFENKPAVVMPKMDGLTVSITYNNGHLIQAETRGDGLIGENVTHNVLTIENVPKTIPVKRKVVIDGEIISTYQNFEKFKSAFANPRNFAAGSLRLLSAEEFAKRNLMFIAWNVIKNDDETSFSKRLLKIQEWGFTTVPYYTLMPTKVDRMLVEESEQKGYPIDGLVGRFDSIEYGQSLGSTQHHANDAYAFKFSDTEYETTLLDIEWNVGRSGVITPVAIFEPVTDGEVTFNRAMLYNPSIIKSTFGQPFQGQKIRVSRNNGVIPIVIWGERVDNIDPDKLLCTPTVCPSCQSPVLVKESKFATTIFCNNPDCKQLLVNRLARYTGRYGANIGGLSAAKLSQLIDWGWVSKLSDIYCLKDHKREWLAKPGFGIKSVERTLANIEKSRNLPLEKFISGLGIPQLGVVAANSLSLQFSTWDDFRLAVYNIWHFEQLAGIGPSLAQEIYDYDYTEADKIAKEYVNILPRKQRTKNLVGQKVAISGAIIKAASREALFDIIYNNGGQTSNTVTQDTTILINNNPNANSTKTIKARELNIPILSEEKFFETYLPDLTF